MTSPRLALIVYSLLAPIGPGDTTILAENGDIRISYTQLSGKFRDSYARPSYSQFQMTTAAGLKAADNI